jgi:hypothetical protein
LQKSPPRLRKSPFIMQKTIPSHTWALKQILWSSAKHTKQYKTCTFCNMFQAYDAKTSTTYVAMPMNHRFSGHPMYLDDISSTLSFLAALMIFRVLGLSHILDRANHHMEHDWSTHEFTGFVDIPRTWVELLSHGASLMYP